MIKTAVLGATGYTGVELVRLLHAHPAVEPVFLSSGSTAGKKYSEVHPQFAGRVDLTLEQMDYEKIPESVEMVFCALPHGKSAEIAAEIYKKGFKVIDLSADYRLGDPELYREWYNLEHPVAEMLGKAVYGLPELNKELIKGARFIANPGCYPTSILLALAPLLGEKIIKSSSIIIDAKSGVSGAGRAPKQPFHFPDCTENFKAYRVANHQHTAEIEQELGRLAGENIKITFTPHLVPMIRGILSTVYAEPISMTSEIELGELYDAFYSDCPFVRILKSPALPETRMVRGTNMCDIAVKYDSRTNRIIIISVIDNLLKGASGQAVQNMNLMLGLPEEEGLGYIAL
ncbi:MAG: N-acetyl-gamma-glutamyl-phosphate reductase [Bacillota bacterium]|nr:N-acetyl-gamma-glutamyl-phosphate reductase [Bacillota bacterium]MDW7729977.1 N-acetyl-gamma-glutamyl-phosphate reductase [Bacillota bacterium]